MISISSAILGSRITKEWLDIAEGNILIVRGKAAVRGLKLLLSNIISVDNRIKLLINLTKENKIDINNIELIFSELGDRCKSLAEETVCSIENWTDITSEADVKTHIGIITDLKIKLDYTEKDLTEMKIEKETIEGKTTIEKNELEIKYREKETEAELLREKLRQKEIGFGISVGTQAATISTLGKLPDMYTNYGIVTQTGITNIVTDKDISDVNNSHIQE